MPKPAKTKSKDAIRASLPADGRGVELVEMVVARAGELELLGWVRDDPDGRVRIHAEGATGAPGQLAAALSEETGVPDVEVESVKVEGHEQFAVRGVSAGVFVVHEHHATAHH